MTLTAVNASLSPVTTGQRRPEAADLKDRADLRQMFEAAGLAQGRNRQWPCPAPDHAQTGATPPVSISNVEGRDLWRCHGCGAGGSAVDFLEIAHGLNTADALEHLAGLTGLSAGTPAPLRACRPARRPEPTPPPLDPNDGRIEGQEGEDMLAKYLEQRGCCPEAAEVFGLYAVRNRRQGPAIRHPYRKGDETKWWQDRQLTQRGPKWFNPEGVKRIPHSIDLTTTMDWALDTDPQSIMVVEGPADVIAMWHVAPGAAVIGLPGTEGAEHWATHLGGLDVLILTDPDDAGDRCADTLARAIHTDGGHSARLRPPADIDDWHRTEGPQAVAEGIQELADHTEWWTPT